MSSITNLPPDILGHIASFLDAPKDQSAFQKTCRIFKDAMDQSVYKELLHQIAPMQAQKADRVEKHIQVDWKSLYTTYQKQEKTLRTVQECENRMNLLLYKLEFFNPATIKSFKNEETKLFEDMSTIATHTANIVMWCVALTTKKGGG